MSGSLSVLCARWSGLSLWCGDDSQITVLLVESLSHILGELGDVRCFASYISTVTSFIY